ncbi:MAG: hypothetical protein VB087_06905 [Candidatus Limiplasma sp.]|nr:hypothetical protein [Candidatus Limiplasma sp.]MEA5146776.1 hypothetical protein [Candidatus Limiplasma sp.]
MNLSHDVRFLAGLFQDKAFVKVANMAEAMFVSDAPRRIGKDALWERCKILHNNGFFAWETPGCMLCIDWSEDRWQQWMAEKQAFGFSARFPETDALWPAYMLGRLLAAHPSPLSKQPRAPLRVLLKNTNHSAGLCSAAQRVHEECAQRLREGQPLPASGAGLLDQWLRSTTKEASLW